ncbi:MAG: sialate O-acetylesterase, partial [Marinoscillum sp.]
MMKNILTTLLVLFLSINALADVRLSSIFTDNMVLQRNQAVKIWGWAQSRETVMLQFNNQSMNTRADKAGFWVVELEPMSYGGPFEMKIEGQSNSIVLKNVLIGDVWIGSGQSNMEWPLKKTKSGETTVASSDNPQIRLFTVERTMSPEPKSEVAGTGWLVASPETTINFSAVAYHFGKTLNADLNVPIGLIHSSWGGTDIKTWMRFEALM